MKIFFTTLAAAALVTTVAFAQTNNTTNSNNTTNTNGSTKSVTDSDCNLLMGKLHPNKEFTKEESAPYIAKMKAMNLAPKTEGVLTSDDFMTGCKAGAFEGM